MAEPVREEPGRKFNAYDFQNAYANALHKFIREPEKRKEIVACFPEKQAKCEKLSDYVSANIGILKYACICLPKVSKKSVDQMKKHISKLKSLTRMIENLVKHDAYIREKDRNALFRLLEALEFRLQAQPNQAGNKLRRLDEPCLKDLENIIARLKDTIPKAQTFDDFTTNDRFIHLGGLLNKVFLLLPWTHNKPVSMNEACLKQFMSGAEMQEFATMFWDLAKWKLDKVIGTARLFCCPKKRDHPAECQEKWGHVDPLKLVSLQYVKGLGRVKTTTRLGR